MGLFGWVLLVIFCKLSIAYWFSIFSFGDSPVNPFALIMTFLHCSIAALFWFLNFLGRKERKKKLAEILKEQALNKKLGVYDQATLDSLIRKSIKKLKNENLKLLFWEMVCLSVILFYFGFTILSLFP